MNHDHLQRQLDIIPIEILSNLITVIGAGAIGSMTTLCLAKIGFENIQVFDDDDVDVVNMNNQFYRFADIGSKKVDALKSLVADFTPTKIRAIPHRYEGQERIPGIVITAVDSMEAREKIWEAHVGKAFGTQLIIDPRMAIEFASCHAVNPLDEADIARYSKTISADEETIQEACTSRSVMYTSLFIGAHVTKVVKDFLCQLPYTRVMLWDIKNNHQDCWYADGNGLLAHA